MAGFVVLGATEPAATQVRKHTVGDRIAFQLTITVDDVDRFLADPDHLARAEGWLDVALYGGRSSAAGSTCSPQARPITGRCATGYGSPTATASHAPCPAAKTCRDSGRSWSAAPLPTESGETVDRVSVAGTFTLRPSGPSRRQRAAEPGDLIVPVGIGADGEHTTGFLNDQAQPGGASPAPASRHDRPPGPDHRAPQAHKPGSTFDGRSTTGVATVPEPARPPPNRQPQPVHQSAAAQGAQQS